MVRKAYHIFYLQKKIVNNILKKIYIIRIRIFRLFRIEFNVLIMNFVLFTDFYYSVDESCLLKLNPEYSFNCLSI